MIDFQQTLTLIVFFLVGLNAGINLLSLIYIGKRSGYFFNSHRKYKVKTLQNESIYYRCGIETTFMIVVTLMGWEGLGVAVGLYIFLSEFYYYKLMRQINFAQHQHLSNN